MKWRDTRSERTNKEKWENQFKSYNTLFNQLKEAPQDEACEAYNKGIQENIKGIEDKLASLQLPAQRRSDLETSLLKAQNFIELQNEQLDNREKKVKRLTPLLRDKWGERNLKSFSRRRFSVPRS